MADWAIDPPRPRDTGLPSPRDNDLLDVPPTEPRVYTPMSPVESDAQRPGEPVADGEGESDA